MVSEIKKHIHRLSTENGERLVEDYVGVIHRLDKPVGGIMVYALSLIHILWDVLEIRRLLRLI